MRLGRAWLVATAMAVSCPPAMAGDVARNGSVITITGLIKYGDENAFKAAASGATMVYLNSPGGFVEPSKDIARAIRTNGMTTIVDASRAMCASACTALFAAGVKRLYLNADNLSDAAMTANGLRGLAYHQGSSILSLATNRYSGLASSEMIGIYYEMGASSAASLASKAPPNLVYRISGRTALSLGIATGTGRP